MILSNVLDPRTYEPGPEGVLDEQHDVNAIPAKERYEMAYARGRCWDILRWFFTQHVIFDKVTGKSIDGFPKIAMEYLIQQCRSIVHFHKASKKNLKNYGTPISSKALRRQMKLCLASFDDIPQEITWVVSESLAYPNKGKFGVRLLDDAPEYCSKRLSPKTQIYV